MGNRFELSVLSDDSIWANDCIDCAISEIQRIEKLLTTFNDQSQTNHVNRMAGIAPVKVDKEVFDLVERSIRISELTQGAFDISYGSIDKRFWNFDTTMTTLPDARTLKESVRLINYKNIILDHRSQSIFLKEKGMRIGFGGIGKGYAADKAKIVMQKMGVTSGIVNAAGDLAAWGKQANGEPYTVGIASPAGDHHPFSFLKISDLAVATSGNYEKYAEVNGKKYSHTIDPKTGFPVSGIKSVTIISTNAEIADALATPVMVMGAQAGIYMINQMKDIACIIIDDHNRTIVYTPQPLCSYIIFYYLFCF